MLKKNMFYISLIIIYLLFLSKDYFFKLTTNLIEVDSLEQNKEVYYQKEYEDIAKLLEIEPNKYEIIYSKILNRDIYEFYDKITIVKGKNSELKVGNIVINNDGLIGVLNKIYDNYSEVSLLTNKDINISVKINDSYGILSAINNKTYVKNIKLQNEIKEGDKVYTSGLTGIPSDILIGTVTRVKKDDLELEYIIEVETAVDFHNLNYVGVVK